MKVPGSHVFLASISCLEINSSLPVHGSGQSNFTQVGSGRRRGIPCSLPSLIAPESQIS